MSTESLATIHPARPDRFADGSVHEERFDFLLAVNFLDAGIPDGRDFGVVQVFFDQDFLRGEMIAPVNRINL